MNDSSTLPCYRFTLDELTTRPTPPCRTFKHVKVKRSNRTIVIRDGDGVIYEIDLDLCTTAAQVLDWIFQVLGKSWCTPELMFELLEAFDHAAITMLGDDIQGAICRSPNDRVSWKRRPDAQPLSLGSRQ